MKVGVLAIQGSFEEHLACLKKLSVICKEVRSLKDLEEVSALIIPGGESTTIFKLLSKYGLKNVLIDKIKSGFPVYGTCAGMILLAKNIDNSLQVMDIEVDRNAYGSQLDSFSTVLTDIDSKLNSRELEAIFIRAPRIKNYGKNVKVLARYKNTPVLLQERNILVSSFHPELTDDEFVYEYFLREMC